MDLASQQAIADLTKRQDANYTRLDEKFESMRLMFETLMDLALATSKPKPPQQRSRSLGPKAPLKQQPRMEHWNQADLGYFDPHLDEKAH